MSLNLKKLVTNTSAAALVAASMAAAPMGGAAYADDRDPGCNGPTGCPTEPGDTIINKNSTKINVAVAPGMGSFSNSCFKEIFVSAAAMGVAAGVGAKLNFDTECGRVQVLTAGAGGPVCFTSVASMAGGGFGLSAQDAFALARQECGAKFVQVQNVSAPTKDQLKTNSRKLKPVGQ